MSRTLTVSADDITAEISILNGASERVARGVGRIEEDLPSGLYKIRVRVGPQVEERLVSMDVDRSERFERQSFPSPIPLAGTSQSHEYHMGAAAAASGQVFDALGVGASVLVFAREWRPPNDHSPVAANPARGLRFCNWEDDRASGVALAERADVRSFGDPSAGWCASVAPGPYRLTLERPDGSAIERAIHASPGWRTQIFLLCGTEKNAAGEAERIVDLAGGTVSLSPQKEFEPREESARLAELACYALSQERHVLSPEFMKRLLDGKWSDPVLGLVGAHLLLRDAPDETVTFETVVRNLVSILGPEHPDVMALQLRLRHPPGKGAIVFRAPPMLRASWDIIVQQSLETPDLIAPDSSAARISTRVLRNSPWLTWCADAGSDDERTVELLEIVESFARSRAAQQIAKAIDTVAKRAQESLLNSEVGSIVLQAPGFEKFKRSLERGRKSLESLQAGHSSLDDLVAQATNDLAQALSLEEKAELARSLGLPIQALEQLLKRGKR